MYHSCDYCITVCWLLREVTVWDIEKAQKLPDSFKLDGWCTKVVFCNHDAWIACEMENEIVFVDHLTGIVLRLAMLIYSVVNYVYFYRDFKFIHLDCLLYKIYFNY